jgi:pyruvate/2-oxoglutarate dehydrogenase complex dihydrolipoamide acyltransferase (E2) component
MSTFKASVFPKSRIATNDVCAVGLQKHHVVAFIEIDVSACREKIKEYRKNKGKISFTAWLLKVIGLTIKDFEHVAAYLQGKRKAIIFDEINISMVVEKELNGQKVPIPLIIEKASERSIESITMQINDAKNQQLTDKDIVLQSKSNRMEHLYFLLPGFIRRAFWKYLIRHPHFAFGKMGNVAVTSIGMMGNANGWFIPISVHPVCFGIGKVTKKAVVIHDKVTIREMLNMTVLMDHDVTDGAMMARFISKLTENIEKGLAL